MFKFIIKTYTKSLSNSVRYEEWKKRSKVEDKEDEDSEDDTGGQTGWKNNKQYMGM